jgi:hypothetical protein
LNSVVNTFVLVEEPANKASPAKVALVCDDIANSSLIAAFGCFKQDNSGRRLDRKKSRSKVRKDSSMDNSSFLRALSLHAIGEPLHHIVSGGSSEDESDDSSNVDGH